MSGTLDVPSPRFSSGGFNFGQRGRRSSSVIDSIQKDILNILDSPEGMVRWYLLCCVVVPLVIRIQYLTSPSPQPTAAKDIDLYACSSSVKGRSYPQPNAPAHNNCPLAQLCVYNYFLSIIRSLCTKNKFEIPTGKEMWVSFTLITYCTDHWQWSNCIKLF